MEDTESCLIPEIKPPQVIGLSTTSLTNFLEVSPSLYKTRLCFFSLNPQPPTTPSPSQMELCSQSLTTSGQTCLMCVRVHVCILPDLRVLVIPYSLGNPSANIFMFFLDFPDAGFWPTCGICLDLLNAELWVMSAGPDSPSYHLQLYLLSHYLFLFSSPLLSSSPSSPLPAPLLPFSSSHPCVEISASRFKPFCLNPYLLEVIPFNSKSMLREGNSFKWKRMGAGERKGKSRRGDVAIPYFIHTDNNRSCPSYQSHKNPAES